MEKAFSKEIKITSKMKTYNDLSLSWTRQEKKKSRISVGLKFKIFLPLQS